MLAHSRTDPSGNAGQTKAAKNNHRNRTTTGEKYVKHLTRVRIRRGSSSSRCRPSFCVGVCVMLDRTDEIFKKCYHGPIFGSTSVRWNLEPGRGFVSRHALRRERPIYGYFEPFFRLAGLYESCRHGRIVMDCGSKSEPLLAFNLCRNRIDRCLCCRRWIRVKKAFKVDESEPIR